MRWRASDLIATDPLTRAARKAYEATARFTATVTPIATSDSVTWISRPPVAIRQIAVTAMKTAPAAIRAAWDIAARLSAFPWPYGCDSSAGCMARRTVKNAMPEANTSSALSTPSPSTATEPNASPMATFTTMSKLFDPKGARGRYVRLYSNGNTTNDLNHYVEIEVFGTQK